MGILTLIFVTVLLAIVIISWVKWPGDYVHPFDRERKVIK